MVGFTRAERTTDFTLMEVLPAVVLVVVLFLGGDWAGEAADEAEMHRALHGEALSIAMQGTKTATGMAPSTLPQTNEFVPVSDQFRDAVRAMGSAPGDSAIDPLSPYAIEVRVTALDQHGDLRRIEVRVGYEQLPGERTWVEMVTVQQDASRLALQPAQGGFRS